MRGEIELKNVSFEYEAGHPIIKNVSLKVEAGKMYGIVGKTGAGKSTIINLMARLYDVTGGEITIDGVPIRKIAFEDLRRNIGIVSQETYLFIGSIADNIRYADPEASMEEVIEAAKSANAHEFITKLPEGYNTRVGEGGISLSGGEKQRISIARAIIQKAERSDTRRSDRRYGHPHRAQDTGGDRQSETGAHDNLDSPQAFDPARRGYALRYRKRRAERKRHARRAYPPQGQVF